MHCRRLPHVLGTPATDEGGELSRYSDMPYDRHHLGRRYTASRMSKGKVSAGAAGCLGAAQLSGRHAHHASRWLKLIEITGDSHDSEFLNWARVPTEHKPVVGVPSFV
jgi:hypothetical protein